MVSLENRDRLDHVDRKDLKVIVDHKVSEAYRVQ
jgi:hypothetical protein